MVTGFADLHNHQFAYLGFGGRAFHGHAFGDLRQALPHCDFGPGIAGPMTEIHGPWGAGDFVGNLIRAMEYGAGFGAALGHKVGGYPEFDGWPRWDSVTHQAVHEDWLYRAVQGGLRLMVMMAVNSEYMCAKVNTDLSCNDMEAVDRQLAAAKQMEAYIDSKSGGPGKGWYRIVYTPDEARSVMMAGKLAVVLGIEVDYLFNCHREADLTEDLLRAQLDRYYAAGVRHLFPIHFDNNGFGATAFQNGLQFGINLENPANNEPGLPLNPFPVFAAYAVPTEDATPFGYEYRTGRRATQGLTELGKTLIREMIARGMIIDIDHMSARAKAEVLDICEAARYPVVAGHVGFVEISRGDKAHEGQLLAAEVERIRRLGGIVAVIVRQGTKDQIKTWRNPGQTVVDHTCSNSSETWVQAYLHAVAKMQGRPVAFGTDFNGLIPPTGPRFGPDACLREGVSAGATRVTYPFIVAATGEWLDHSVVGEKTFDINDDGLAHIGLLPDFIADLQVLGLTKNDLAPLLQSAEEYVRVWEDCSPGHTRLGVLNTAGELSVKEGPLDAGWTLEAGGIRASNSPHAEYGGIYVAKVRLRPNFRTARPAGPGPVFLVLDGHPVHRSKAVKQFAESTNGRLRLCFLPGGGGVDAAEWLG